MTAKHKEKEGYERRESASPRPAKSFAKHVRARKAEIRRTTSDPVEQEKKLNALLGGLSYKKEEKIEGAAKT